MRAFLHDVAREGWEPCLTRSAQSCLTPIILLGQNLIIDPVDHTVDLKCSAISDQDLLLRQRTTLRRSLSVKYSHCFPLWRKLTVTGSVTKRLRRLQGPRRRPA